MAQKVKDKDQSNRLTKILVPINDNHTLKRIDGFSSSTGNEVLLKKVFGGIAEREKGLMKRKKGR